MSRERETELAGSEVVARAPVRVDLAGGTLDLWPLGLLHPGACTVSVAISLRVEARASRAPDARRHLVEAGDLGRSAQIAVGEAGAPPRGLELLAGVLAVGGPRIGLRLRSVSPVRAGSGLGTSSALGVAALAAVDAVSGRRRPRASLVATVRDLEARILGIPTGEQDHWAAVRGGALAISYPPGGPSVERVDGVLGGLDARLLVIDSGEGRSSGPSNWDLFSRRLAGERAAVAAFGEIAEAGRRAAAALRAGDFPALGAAMRRDADARRSLSPLVMTPRLEAIFDAADRAGALGIRACGAGGGGFAVALARDADARPRVAAAVTEAGGVVARVRPAARGLAVRRQPPATSTGMLTS